MEIQPIRYMSADLKFPRPMLREVVPSQKKHLYELSDSRSAIIIDYGSESIKAGYEGSSANPELVFRPYVSKNRDPNRSEQPVKQAINTSFDQLDFQKITYKSAYQRNIILHFSILQQCNDYIFAEMVRPSKQIRSPFIISEPFANPIHCRSSILEQFFQCYKVDSVMIGIDTLFAYFYELGCNMDRYEKQSAIVIDMGSTSIHIVAIVNGRVQWQTVQRINVGGSNAFQLFGKTVQLKNPQLKNKLTYSYLHDLYDRFTSVAIDYKDQLNFMKMSFDARQADKMVYRNRIEEANKGIHQVSQYVSPMEIDFETFIEVPEEEIRRKEEIKQRMSQKLRETINRRKQMKKRIQQKQLNDLKQLKDKYQQHDPSAHEEVAELFGQHKPHDKLLKKIKAISIKLGLIEEKQDQKKFSLIDIPDNELPPEKIKFKKMQIYQKKAMEERRKKVRDREDEEQKMRDLREYNPEEYLAQLRRKYQTLSKRVKENDRIKSQLSNRKSRLKQKKMQILAKMADDELDDNFGDHEDDWLVYKDAEESDHYSQMEAMEVELREIDPQWMQTKKDIHHLNSSNQLFLTSQLVKCNQIFFQPRLVGVNQNGVIEGIVSALGVFPSEIQKKLLENVHILGGSSQISGLKERMSRDLRRECPVDLEINVKISEAGWKGAFLGMQNIARMQSEFIPKMSYHRHDYEDKQKSQYLKFAEHPWSNPKPNI